MWRLRKNTRLKNKTERNVRWVSSEFYFMGLHDVDEAISQFAEDKKGFHHCHTKSKSLFPNFCKEPHQKTHLSKPCAGTWPYMNKLQGRPAWTSRGQITTLTHLYEATINHCWPGIQFVEQSLPANFISWINVRISSPLNARSAVHLCLINDRCRKLNWYRKRRNRRRNHVAPAWVLEAIKIAALDFIE